MTHETVSGFLARKQRERNGSYEHASTSSSSELFQIDNMRSRTGGTTDTGNAVRDLYGRLQRDAGEQQRKESGAGPYSGIGAFARFLTEPLVDVPDLPGPLNLIEQGVEQLSSPIGLAAALLVPITGGTSLGLAGAAGIGVRAATVVGSEILVGGAAVGASSFVNDRLPDSVPGPLRLIANVAAGAAAGGAVSVGIRRSLAENVSENIIKNIQDPTVQKLARILDDTPELIQRQAEALTRFRGEQLGRFEAGLSGGRTEAQFRSARGAMTGAAERVADEDLLQAIRGQFSTDEITELYQPLYGWFEQGGPSGTILTGQEGLVNLLSGITPTDSQFRALSQIYGTGLENVVRQKGKGAGQQLGDFALDLANVPRSLAASADMSAPLRQGILLIGHPKQFAESFGVMIKSFGSQKVAAGVLDRIGPNTPRGQFLRSAGVDITDFRQGLSNHEELFLSRMVNNIPGIGQVTRASERAYTVFLNKLRADTFESVTNNWRAAGKVATEEELSSLAHWVNAATGRSSAKFLKGNLGRTLTAGFFSPQYFVSRLEAPSLLLTAPPAVRAVVAKDLGVMIGAGVGVLSLLKMSGFDVELDPRSSDFGKGHVGNTRFDFWGGYQPIVRYSTQLIMDERKTTSTKRVIPIDNRLETVGRFFQSKLAPTTGLGVDILRGETVLGDELKPDVDTLAEQVFARNVPFFMQDVIESFTESGMLVGAATTPASFFGIGTSSFSSTQQLLEQYGLDIAEPNERLQILAEKPELAEELVRRNELSATQGSEAAQRRVDQDAIREQYGIQQQSADSLFLNGEMSAGQWRDQRKIIKTASRASIETLYRNVEPSGEETALDRFFTAIQAATNDAGQVDWDGVDLWRSQQSAADNGYIERNTGLKDTELEKAYRVTLDDLDGTGFFALSDRAWENIAPRAGLAQADFYEYRTSIVNQITQGLVQQGQPSGVARQEAERQFNLTAIAKAYSELKNNFETQWIQQHPQLAADATKWNLLSTKISERQFITGALR